MSSREFRGEEWPDLEVACQIERVGVGPGVRNVGCHRVPEVDEGPELRLGEDVGVVEGKDGAANGEILEDAECDGFHVCNCSSSATAAQKPVKILMLCRSGGETGAVGEDTFNLEDAVRCKP